MRKKLLFMFGLCLAMNLIVMIAPTSALCETTTQNKLLDPLYIAATIIAALFGITSWSLNRNLKAMDSKFDTVFEKVDTISTTQVEHGKQLAKLQGAHDERTRQGGCG